MKDKINKLLVIFTIIIGIMIVKSNFAYADTSAYYLGSKDATKATGYNQSKDSNGNNIEATLDMSSQLDKMLYYILTYEEYDNKTYVGDSSLLNLEERKQAAIYYLVHNYKQNINQYSNFTSNEKLKAIFENYTGSGNNLSEFDDKTRNGVQVIYGLSEAWAKGEDMAKAAQKLKINYKALSDDNFKYWASITEEPLEGSIYNPGSEDNTLIVTVYLPKEEEKTAQNAIKVVEKEIVEEKKELIKNLIKSKGVTIGSINNLIDTLKTEPNSILTRSVGIGYGDSFQISGVGTYTLNRMVIPNGHYCMDHSKGIWYAENYTSAYKTSHSITNNNKYVLYHIFSYSNGKNYTYSDSEEYIKQVAYWKYLKRDANYNTSDTRGAWSGVASSVQTSGKKLYNSAKDKSAPSVTNESSNPSCTYENGSYWYGPFKIKYSNLLRRDSLRLKLGTINVSLSNCYSSKSSSTSLSDINSNSTFYIKSSTAGYNNLEVTYKTVSSFNYTRFGTWNDGGQPFMNPNWTLEDKDISISIKTTEQYNIQLYKYDSISNELIKTKKATFTIGGTDHDTSNGVINITGQNPPTGSTTTKDISIHEKTAPSGYSKDNNDTIKINVSFSSSNQMKITSFKVGNTTINSNDKWITAKTSSGADILGYQFALNKTTNTIRIKVKDTPCITPEIRIKKVDKDTGAALGGVTFEAGGTTLTTATSGNNKGYTPEKGLGELLYNETKSIEIQETGTITGYKINNQNKVKLNYKYDSNGLTASWDGDHNDYSVSVDKDAKLITVTVKDSKIKYNLTIKKVNSQNQNQVIPGVKFKVNDGDAIKNETPTTGNNGLIEYKDKNINRDSFNISIQETTPAPNNLNLDYTGAISIKVKVDGKTGGISTEYTDKTKGVYTVSTSGNTINVVVKDTPYITPKLKITKVDSTNSNTKLRWCKV